MGAIFGVLGGGFALLFGWKHLSSAQIADNLDKTFNSLDSMIQGAVELVTQPVSLLDGIWSVVSNVHSAVLPMGYSLLVLFFLLGFMNKSLSFRIIRIEDIIRLLLKLIISKSVMENSFNLLNLVYGMVTDLIMDVNFSSAPIKLVDTHALAEQISKMNLLEKIVFQTQFTPITLVNSLLSIWVFIICYGRIIELCVFTAVAPLPIATLSSEEYASISKRFFQHYIGICLHGLIIVLVCMLFGGLAKTILGSAGTENDFGVGASLVLSITLILVLSKSESWARQITGVN